MTRAHRSRQRSQPFSVSLRRWRAAAGLTQKRAASLLGAPLGTYRNWEGAVNKPTSFTKHQIFSIISKPAP